MKIKTLTIILLFSLSAAGQTNRRIEKLKIKVKEAEIFKQIEESKNECTILVSRIKQTKSITNDSLKIKYSEMKNAYDKIIDTMIYDINSANTIGGLVEYFATTSNRYSVYEKLLNEAKQKENDFKLIAYTELKEEKGIIKDIVDWGISFLPGWVKKISDNFLKAVKDVIISRIEEVKFDDWDDIRA